MADSAQHYPRECTGKGNAVAGVQQQVAASSPRAVVGEMHGIGHLMRAPECGDGWLAWDFISLLIADVH